MPILEKLLRAGEGRVLRRLQGYANQVNALEEDFVKLSDAELREETDRFKARLADGEKLDHLIPEAFANVREAAKRSLGQRHFDVQLMGGVALHLGNIAEMKTGEGKTLVATLPAYLNGLVGKGVHIVTVNDYLASYQSELMGRVFRFLGLTSGCVLDGMNPEERRREYGLDITYGTNTQFGFDYLRDNMAWNAGELVQRTHHFAIVDEVDSILIDEARTPLIISGPATGDATRWYAEFAKIVKRLRLDTDYEVDEKKRTVGVHEPGIEKVEDYLGIENLYDSVNTPYVGYLNNAIKAKELFKRDKDYVVTGGEVMIVDEHTGRMLKGRRYNEGMHQAIEAKEGVPIKAENQTLATITLQNYFRLYEKLSGMTGTAMTESAEFQQIYSLGVIPIPTNMPMRRKDQSDLVYKTEPAKFEAVVQDIVERHTAGQPVLVGTVSVEKSEYLSTRLRAEGIDHEVLNAKQHAREASIVSMAGRPKAVTVATNMAGRGTDIMLGGNAEFLAVQALADAGLDPAENPAEYEAAWPQALEDAQKRVKDDHDAVVELGGLYVLGTERHESRRIDNQLRGRSGRQGDPGESRFYLSLTDDLMRLFNSQVAESLLTRAGIPEDVPLESKMVSRAIQSAQSQVEARNFEIRKNVLKYDDVLNRQREVIYSERRRVLEGADLQEQVRHFIDDVIGGYVTAATAEGFPDDWDLDQLFAALKTLYPVSVTVDELIEEAGGRSGLSADMMVEELVSDAHVAYDRREAEIGEDAMRELERRVVLSVLDRKWREHLYEMDYLQEGISLRAMAQKDPLVEYQREGFQLYQAMTDAIKEESVGFLFNLEVQVAEPEEAAVAEGVVAEGAVADGAVADGAVPAAAQADGEPVPVGADGGEKAAAPATRRGARLVAKGLEAPDRPAQLQYSAPTTDGEGGVEVHMEGATDSDTGGEYPGTPRNAPCPCGSGKKYKRCHGDPRRATTA